MILLAIEQSSTTGSLALFKDGSLLAERAWEDSRLRSQQFSTSCHQRLRMPLSRRPTSP